jgi:subfamily B ATP-binding cassette protein MsbA
MLQRLTSTPPADPRKSSRAAWHDARALLWEHRYRLLAGLGLLFVGRIAALALPASSKYLIDEVITKQHGERLGLLAIAIVAASLVQAGTSMMLSRILGLAAQRAIMDIRRQLQQKVLHLPVSFFDQTKSGVLIARIMSDPDALRNLIGSGLVQLASSVLTALLALGVLLWLNWRLTSMTVVLLAVFGALVVYAFRRIRPLFRQRAEINSQVVGRLSEALGGIRVVKAYRAEDTEHRVFTDGLERLFASVKTEVRASSSVGAAALVIFGMISALLVYVGGRGILSGAMSLGDFIMYVFFIGLLVAPVIRFTDSATQLSEAFAGLDRVRELRDRPTEESTEAGFAPFATTRAEIEFDHVGFEYTPGVPVLKGVSFRAAAGSTTALVGPSGAGKSTVIGLVMGFHRPTAGRVLVDGRDLATVATRDLRANLGVVFQENFLFDGTIADNIAYGRAAASRDEVVAAARRAHCDEFVTRLEHGYETLVGERGVRLSGGQRQRLAIARALLADPRILILDEATSSLDSESEALVQDGLKSLREGRTTLVIAHRLSTVRSADQILVMDGGVVVQRGTHESLMTQGGRYRELYERQFRTDVEAHGVVAELPEAASAAGVLDEKVPSLLDRLLPK